MPGKVKVKIVAARHLPVMDRSSENTDAFAEVKFGEVTHKTEVVRKSLNPVWNSEWFRFEAAGDTELQDEPLQIRVMDYDTYSANDAIGKVYVDLNPLLLAHTSTANPSSNDPTQTPKIERKPGGSQMSGWLPIYDTIQGIRGEVNVMVKVDLFSDLNKFRQSSCGVRFFCCTGVPEGYYCHYINGFVEELVVNSDPEYQWIDKIRTPRASNEARQTLFMKLSGAVQRKIGLKALELGGNCVVGYQQKFDLEGDTGIAVRGIGTAMTLVKIDDHFNAQQGAKEVEPKESEPPQKSDPELESSKEPLGPKSSGLSTDSTTSKSGVTLATLSHPEVMRSKSIAIGEQARGGSPDSDNFSPKAGSNMSNSWNENQIKVSQGNRYNMGPKGVTVEGQDLLEYPFITLQKFPDGFLNKIGGIVSARSVKLLDGIDEDEDDTRDLWWTELRKEVRSHARCLGCNVVVGYSEDTVIWDDVVVLCASGTAALADLTFIFDLETHGNAVFGPPFLNSILASGQQNRGPCPNGNNEENLSGSLGNMLNLNAAAPISANFERSNSNSPPCSYAHIPYLDYSLPYACKSFKCSLCGKGRVPDVLFTTIEPPSNFDTTGRGCLLQAKVLRLKKDLKGEHNAKEVSESLPFIEYEIHRQLVNKLKVKGMNALFGLKIKVSIGDRTVIGTATATACYLTALPAPNQPKLVCSSFWQNDPQYLTRQQKRLESRVTENATYYGLGNPRKSAASSAGKDVGSVSGDLDTLENIGEVDDQGLEADFSAVNHKETCILEIDDSEDVDILDSLMDPFPPPFIQTFSTEELIGVSPGHYVKGCQTFSQVWRGRIHPSSRDLTTACERLLAAIYFKLRRVRPCIVCHVNFQADLDDENELQLCVYGTAIALGFGGKTKPEMESVSVEQQRVSADTSGGTSGSSGEEKRNNGEEKNIGKGDDQKSISTHSSTSISGPNSNSSAKSETTPPPPPVTTPATATATTTPAQPASKAVGSLSGGNNLRKFYSMSGKECFNGITLTPLSFVPGARIDKYLGNLNFFLIRETSSLREVGGLNTFIQTFLSEVYAIVRCHVAALDGNALVGYFMSEFAVEHSLHKNQGQCVIHVGGDVVSVSYITK